MPRKIRQLVADLKRTGWFLDVGAGKGSHRKFRHGELPYFILLSGGDGQDAKPYQEKDVKRAVADAETRQQEQAKPPSDPKAPR